MWPAKCLLLIVASVSVALASPVTFHFSGTLDPAANTNLTYFDQFTGLFTAPIAGPDDYDRAFNIAVHTFPVSVAGPVRFESLGFGLGGFDSVLSVFQGTGDTATYLHHEYNLFAPGDFSFDLNLGVGMYTLAISMFLNEPCAAGGCSSPMTGTFGDGFTNLVNFNPLAADPLFYSVNVTTAIPEPSSGLLLAAGLLALLAQRRPRQR